MARSIVMDEEIVMHIPDRTEVASFESHLLCQLLEA